MLRINHFQNMKLRLLFTYLLLLPAVVFLSQGCNQCSVSGGTLTFDAANQFLAVTYLVDSSGSNYCQNVYNPNNVQVLFNDNGGFGQYVPIQEDLSDGKIGPFPYTTSPAVAKKGVFHHYVYVVQKDTFGIDTFDVKFYPAVDECQEFWSLIEFYMNGVLLPLDASIEFCDVEIRQ